MNPYSGLVDLFEKQGILKKDGNRLLYTDSQGQEHKEYRKNWTGELLDMVMKDSVNLNDKVNMPSSNTEDLQEMLEDG